MTNERLILGISEDTVVEVLDDPRWDEDSADAFAQEVMSEIENDQPALFRFIQLTLQYNRSGDPDWVSISTTMSYKMLPEEMRRDKLEQKHIDVVRRSMFESQNPNTPGAKSATVNVSWALGKLQKDSPAYVEWLNDSLTSMDTKEAQSDFVLGAIVVVLPFYMREEARRMEKRL